MFNQKKKTKEEETMMPDEITPGAPVQEAKKIESSSPESSAKRAGLPSEVNAYFGKGSKFSGKLSFEGTVRIDGVVEGEIQSKDKLIIGESAEINANITVDNVFISGSVRGDVYAKGRIELLRTGKVYGNICTSSLMVQEGGILEGACSMAATGVPQAKEEPAANQKDEPEIKKIASVG